MQVFKNTGGCEKMKDYEKIRNEVKAIKGRKSAWNDGVLAYAIEMINKIEDSQEHICVQAVLNGCDNFIQLSETGRYLTYDDDIVNRLMTPANRKKFADGKLDSPNKYESWLDIQAKAMGQAWYLISKTSAFYYDRSNCI
jgi:hypothetical protein